MHLVFFLLSNSYSSDSENVAEHNLIKHHGKVPRIAMQDYLLTVMQVEPTLEGLPIELRIHILFQVQDLSSLRTLVFASPVYYQAYQLVRPELLQVLLEASYDGLVDRADAVAAVRSRGLYAIEISNRERIIALLDERRRSDEIRQLSISPAKILPDQPADVDETIQLLRLHRMASFLLEDYSRTAKRPEFIESAKWNDQILPLKLSTTEKRRFLRAFYRLQIYGNIFGPIEIPLNAEPPEKENDWSHQRGWDPSPPDTFSEEEVWRLFFATMAPWELEELCCFWLHCYTRWAAPYFEIAYSLLGRGVLFMSELPEAEIPPIRRRFFDNDDLKISQIESRESLASMGPAFLIKILREPDFLTRRNLVIANVSFWAHIFPEFWPHPNWDDTWALPLVYPADKFNFGTDVTGLRNLLDMTPLPYEKPNSAWRQRWIDAELDFPEVFVDMFSYGGRARRWDWGYVIWDDERLAQWGTPNMSEKFPGNVGGV